MKWFINTSYKKKGDHYNIHDLIIIIITRILASVDVGFFEMLKTSYLTMQVQDHFRGSYVPLPLPTGEWSI